MSQGRLLRPFGFETRKTFTPSTSNNQGSPTITGTFPAVSSAFVAATTNYSRQWDFGAGNCALITQAQLNWSVQLPTQLAGFGKWISGHTANSIAETVIFTAWKWYGSFDGSTWVLLNSGNMSGTQAVVGSPSAPTTYPWNPPGAQATSSVPNPLSGTFYRYYKIEQDPLVPFIDCPIKAQRTTSPFDWNVATTAPVQFDGFATMAISGFGPGAA